MAKVNIKKISVIALQKDQEKVLSILQKLGCAEFVDINGSLDSAKSIELAGRHNLRQLKDKQNELNFAINFLGRYQQLKKSIFDQKPRYSMEEMKKITTKSEVEDTVVSCRELEKRVSELKSSEMKFNNTIENLEPWQHLDIPVEELGSTRSSIFQTGTITEKNMEEFQLKTTDLSAVHVEKISEDNEHIYMLLAFHKDIEKEMGEVLSELGWARQELPQIEGTPADGIALAHEKLEEIEQERKKIQEKAIDLAQHVNLLEVAYDYYTILIERESAAQNLAATDKVFKLEGWVPETETAKVRETLTEEIDGLYIEFNEPEEDDEDVPTVVDNPGVVEPYELITNLYSPPGKKDIDPNIFMVPFFFLFFGMMISDAGYGIVLAIISFIALRKIKPEGQGKKLFQLIFLGGISTFLWGVLYGGWFGELIKIPPLWINPLEDPITILILSFIMGGIQIFTGLILQGYKNIKNGNVTAAIYDQGFWIIFLAGFVLFVIPGAQAYAKYVVFAGAGGLVLTQGRSQKNIIARLGSGILSLYDVTSYLSDVLSYSRIMALGLATGVIATVINTMAELVGVNIIGYIAMAVVLVVGHLFNIAINSLGAYVHTSRLQYVEFFSKFYEGGGRLLDPFAIKTKYIKYRYGEEKI